MKHTLLLQLPGQSHRISCLEENRHDAFKCDRDDGQMDRWSVANGFSDSHRSPGFSSAAVKWKERPRLYRNVSPRRQVQNWLLGC